MNQVIAMPSHHWMHQVEELVVQYCGRYNLQNWRLSRLFTAYRESENPPDERCWRGSSESFKSGCYFIYTSDGELMYVGKSSQEKGITIGHRLWDHCRKYPAVWSIQPAYIKILNVEQDFEACSLEEFLIKKLHPRLNQTANRICQVGLSSNVWAPAAAAAENGA